MPSKYTQSNAKELLKGCSDDDVESVINNPLKVISDKKWRRLARQSKTANKYGVLFSHGKPLQGGLCK